MSSVPAGKRRWSCPDCGGDVLLSVTQLDPLACPECLAKLKGSHSGKTAVNGEGNASSLMLSLPEPVKLAGVALIALLVGLLIGFVAGRVTAPSVAPSNAASSSSPVSPDRDADSEASAETPDEPQRSGSKWVKEYTRKDGTKVKGHWVRDSKPRN